jgi:glutamate transport system permease protein
VRTTPLTLVFLFFVFAYPYLDIIEMSFFTAAVVALSVYTSAFICEVVRSGINTVPLGQAEAARALGLTFGQSLSEIILPQALRSVVPPLVSTLIALLKNTTIAAGFSVAEAGRIRSVLSDDGENQLVGLLWVALGFIILVMVLTFVQRSLEKRWSVAR